MTYVLAAIIFLALGGGAMWLYTQKTREALRKRIENLELQKDDLKKSAITYSNMYTSQLEKNKMFQKLVHCIEGPTQFEGNQNEWEVSGTNGFLRQGILYPTIDIKKNPNIIVVNKTTKEVKIYNYSGKFGVLSGDEQEAASQQTGGGVSREQVEATITQAKQPGQTMKTATTTIRKGK